MFWVQRYDEYLIIASILRQKHCLFDWRVDSHLPRDRSLAGSLFTDPLVQNVLKAYCVTFDDVGTESILRHRRK